MASLHKQKVLKLYKLILKLHRGMPAELEAIGSNYVKDEFRRHKNCSTQESQVFIREWTEYAVLLSKQLIVKRPEKTKQLGKELSETHLEKLRDDQIMQLYDLMEATKELSEESKKD